MTAGLVLIATQTEGLIGDDDMLGASVTQGMILMWSLCPPA